MRPCLRASAQSTLPPASRGKFWRSAPGSRFPDGYRSMRWQRAQLTGFHEILPLWHAMQNESRAAILSIRISCAPAAIRKIEGWQA